MTWSRAIWADGRCGRRVVVTGLGVVSPVGIGADAFWDALLGPGAEGKVGADPRLGPGPWFDGPEGRPPGRPLPAVRHGRRR